MLSYTDSFLDPYAVMVFVGSLVTLIFTCFRYSKYHITFAQFIMLFVLCALGCFWGSKLLYLAVMFSLGETVSWDMESLFLGGGYVFYGGLFGAIFGVWLFVRLTKGLCLQDMLQMAVPAWPLFHGFGRIGCALAGCCYGVTLPAGIVFPNGYELYYFPTQITEAVFEFALFGLMCFWEKRKKQVDLLKTYLLSYGVFRFFLEFYRADIYRGEWLGFSTSQWISLLIIGYYAAGYGRHLLKSRRTA